MKHLSQDQITFVKFKIQTILNQRFNSGPKTNIREHRDRLNFACPYCGDSADDSYKKRGNLYLNNLMYHCYNGGCNHPHSNFIEFVKDFNESISNLDSLNSFLDFMNQNRYDKFMVSDIEEGEVFSKFKQYGIPLEVVKKKLNLKEVKDSSIISNYLRRRLLIHKSPYFLTNQTEDQLFIFNFLTRETVIGFQIRYMQKDATNKYKSFTIEKLNEIVYDKKINEADDIVIKMNSLSIYFGIIQADFSSDLTIMEGPLDSMFIKNSIAIAGADKSLDIFEDVDSVKYLLDNDRVGIAKMEELLKKRKQVFMWKKLISDYKIKEKIKDINDLVLYCWRTKSDAIKQLDKYFTSNPLDLLYV